MVGGGVEKKDWLRWSLFTKQTGVLLGCGGGLFTILGGVFLLFSGWYKTPTGFFGVYWVLGGFLVNGLDWLVWVGFGGGGGG